MAIVDCLRRLSDAGVAATKNQREKVLKEADRLENMYRAQGDIPEANIRQKAELDAVHGLAEDIKFKRYATAIEVEKTRDLHNFVTNSGEAQNFGPTVAMRATLTTQDIPTSRINAQGAGAAAHGRATAHMNEFVETFRSKIPGGFDTHFRKNKNAINDVVRNLFGDQDVSDVAKGFAKVYDRARNGLLDELETNGVKMKRLENFGLSQKYLFSKVERAGKQKWIDEVVPRLDRSKMFDDNGHLLDEAGIRRLVANAFDDIVDAEVIQQGASKIGASANALSPSRKLHYKSGKDFLEINEMFGDPDVFDGMMKDLEGLAQDVGIVEVFGPNPDRVFNAVEKAAQKAQKQTKVGRKIAGLIENPILNHRMTYNVLRGKTEGIANPKIGNALAAHRNLAAAAFLGRAVLSAIGDQALIASQARLWGLSYTKILSREVLNLFSSSKSLETRQIAARSGQALDHGRGVGSAGNRMGELSVQGRASGAAAKMADITIRGQGLAKVTREGKMVFGNELNGMLAAQKAVEFENLPEHIKNGFSVYGIKKAEWDEMRRGIWSKDGVDWLDPTKMERTVSTRFVSMIENEIRHAVPEPGAEVRGASTGGAAAGTASRELRSNFFIFKGFPMSVALHNTRRALFHPSNQGIMNKTKFIAHLMLYGSIAGGLSIQMQQIAMGKDFRDMTDPSFYLESLAHAATFGISLPIGIAESFVEPGSEIEAIYGIVPPIVRFVTGGSVAAADTVNKLATEQKISPKMTKWLMDNVKVGTPYTDLMYQRLFEDQMQSIVDPKSGKKFRRSEKRLYKDTGQRYWWRPGESSPSRSPEMSEAPE